MRLLYVATSDRFWPFLDGQDQWGGILWKMAILQWPLVRPRVDKEVDGWEEGSSRESVRGGAFKVSSAQMVS